ncbi:MULTISPECIES: efflux RND transporter periplasmic adaptor subunit [unclassified Shimia]|uniref:efflux RND transporter periplasmic adaptor subunit n=1 Tax=unclassified Shimia TaxID=2630038 RepID=UPI001ADD08E0|nr:MULTISPECIES: efflux RND transporter periplasmic adaptor subunit [unclassified Shimia]MBO9474270.1 efflux RND transporter periplasmic adaptor subunit [Shimia sp. R10_1]MDA5558305.1 efflux RND transporter periplasmic adaptor subunit [Shimia sp. MMG029]
MKFLRQSLTGLFLLSLTAALMLYAGYLIHGAVQDRLAQDIKGPPANERVFTVNVQRAEPGVENPELVAFGEVQSRRSLEVRAAAAGTVVQLSENFEDGARVTSGEVLVQVDPTKARYALDRGRNDLLDAQAEQRDADRTLALARDELNAAQAQLALRQTAFARQVDLQERGVGTAASVETAELAQAGAQQAVLSNRRAVAQAEARVDQAKTRLERTSILLAEAQKDLDDTRITADFSGTLSEVTIVQGGLVSLNERLATLIDADALEVAFRVSTTQYARLLDPEDQLVQAEVRVSLDALNTDLSATGVITRDAAAVGEGQTGRVLFARLDSARGLKPGDFVTVRVTEPALENVVRLPATALSATGEVLIVGEGNRLQARKVTLIRRQQDDVLVRAPEITGELVVTRRTPLLGEGISVKPLTGDRSAIEAPEMVALSDEERQRFVAAIEGNRRMPSEAKERMLRALAEPEVPARMVERLRSRMGG